MDETPNLDLPYIMAAQAQKHVTHNESIKALDAIIQLAVLDRDLTSPPASPSDGDRYIVAAGATGEWLSNDDQIAAWQDGAWAFYIPNEGWLVWIADEDVLLAHDGTSWSAVSSSGGGPTNLNPATGSLVGVNATADTTNRFAVASAASLFNHDGNNHQQKINKATESDTASQLYQTAFSGRAEIGLTGDDNFHFKVSPDGTTFHEGIVIDKNTGMTSFPNTSLGRAVNLLINGDMYINQRLFGGGALAAGAYGYDRWKAGVGGANLSESGGIISHNSGPIVQVIEAQALAGEIVTLSVEDLTGGNLDVYIEGQTGTISAGSGRNSVTLTIPASSTNDIAAQLIPASSAVTYKNIRLERGSSATAWTPRFRPEEQSLCMRYYQRFKVTLRDADYAGLNWAQKRIYFLVPMRAVPTITEGSSVDLNLYYKGTTNVGLDGFDAAIRSLNAGDFYASVWDIQAESEL